MQHPNSYVDNQTVRYLCDSSISAEQALVCEQCGKSIKSARCLQAHKAYSCKNSFTCSTCGIRFRASGNRYKNFEEFVAKHECGDSVCGLCFELIRSNSEEPPHWCTMLEPQFQSLYNRICCFDFETRLDDSNEHVVNAIVAEVFSNYIERGHI